MKKKIHAGLLRLWDLKDTNIFFTDPKPLNFSVHIRCVSFYYGYTALSWYKIKTLYFYKYKFALIQGNSSHQEMKSKTGGC